MKFAYSYKMSDGVRREGTIDAPSRDEAFATLRKDGIRPIKMFAAEDPDAAAAAARARTRRGVFIGIGVGILIAAAVWGFFAMRMPVIAPAAPPPPTASAEPTVPGPAQPASFVAKPRPRRWLEHRGEFNCSQIFSHPSEAYLARFAEPGVMPKETPSPLSESLKEDMLDCLADDILLSPGEDEDVAMLKRIVAGLKSEVELMLGAGMTVEDAIARFEERQKMEIEHRDRILQDVRAGRMSREEANRNLSRIGLRGVE